MIKINNVFKTFKNKGNKIEAIKDTTLSLDNKGLVALLGPSGCGKTTLLNAIGGLDKINSGSIYIDNELISSKFSNKVDKIRSKHIGYIFQDYKLIDNLSVYENIEIMLKMIGVKNKSEIKERIEFVLTKVDMLRYKKRPCGMLSGGERQRVAIARALVKNPDIILADEPTGNLDSKNSLEIMKIISAIAKEKLVILVTHEKELAKFYATRVIEIKDGIVINDYANKNIEDLDYEIENRFYLKDFANIETLSDKNHNINIYSDAKEKVNFDIVFKNGNIYIKSDQKVEVIDEHSNIELVNEKYKKIAKEELDTYNFDMEEVIKTKEIKYTSIFNIFTFFSNGFKKVFKYSFLKKILLAGFFVTSCFILVAFGIVFKTVIYDEKDYKTFHEDYVLVEKAGIELDKFKSIESNKDLLVLPTDSAVKVTFFINPIEQINQYLTATFSVSDLESVSDSQLLYGKMPENEKEILLDIFSINKLLESESYKMVHLLEAEDFINLEILTEDENNYKIVGIVANNNPSIYIYENEIINFISSIYDADMGTDTSATKFVDYVESPVKIVEGKTTLSDFEIIVNENSKYMYEINKEYIIEGKTYKVVGYYETELNINDILVSNSTIKYQLFGTTDQFAIKTDNKEELIDLLQVENIIAVDSLEYTLEIYKEALNNINGTIFIIGIIILGVSLLEILLIIRASFLSRIKEVGIYRAIGLKKNDIYKMFVGEIIAITVLVSLPGLLLTYYVLSSIEFFELIMVMNPGILVLAFIFISLFNIIMGLMPVSMTIMKTPAHILARNDVE